MSKIISRAEARKQGLKRYYTGRLCSNGHKSARYVCNKKCTTCAVKEQKQWYNDNQPRVIANNKRRRNLNPIPARYNAKTQRARRRKVEGKFTVQDVRDLFTKQKGKCLCLANLANFHIDHKTPISRGGSNWPRNLQLLCAPCNLDKGAKTMAEWRPS